MIERVFGFFHRQLLLAETTTQNQKEIDTLRRDVQRLEITVERLVAEIAFIKSTERLEREKLALQLSQVLSQFERQLPRKD